MVSNAARSAGLLPGETKESSKIIQGGGNDLLYREKYRDYLARRERERKAAKAGIPVEDIPTRAPRKVRRLKNGTVLDEAFMKRFVKLYNSPMSVKMVCVELRMSNNMAYKLAKENELTTRQHPKSNKKRTGETKAWRLQIDAKLLARLDQHIWMKYRSRQQYITMLLKRELELHGL